MLAGFVAAIPIITRGTAFVVDSKIEEHYKETIRGICQSIRRTKDFTK